MNSRLNLLILLLSRSPIFRSTLCPLPIFTIQCTFDYIPLITSVNSNLLFGIYHHWMKKKSRSGTVSWFLNSISMKLMINLIVSIYWEFWCVIVTCWWVQNRFKITVQWFILNFGHFLLFITLFVACIYFWLVDSSEGYLFDYVNWWLEC